MQATEGIRNIMTERTSREAEALLHCVVIVPEDRGHALDKLMSEQGQCWVGGSARRGSQSPLIKYEFGGAVDRIKAMNRAVTAILDAIDVKFYTFVVPR
jgi:hypothetical protein